MKTWNNAELISVELQETANGGNQSGDFDQQWFDSNAALHVTFDKLS